jgi:methylmalonyl-CoA/ethylmalonyl-CoA epimerase
VSRAHRLDVASALPLLGRVDQICFLVEDLDVGVASYSELFPATSWREYRYGPDTVPRLSFADGPGKFSFRLALSDCDPQIELIQSLSGPSIYSEWIERRGYGLHHLGFFTNDIEGDAWALRAQGLCVSQWGRGYGLDGDGGFTYFDSVARFGFVIELIEIPRRRREPQREWTIGRRADRHARG